MKRIMTWLLNHAHDTEWRNDFSQAPYCPYCLAKKDQWVAKSLQHHPDCEFTAITRDVDNLLKNLSADIPILPDTGILAKHPAPPE